MRAVVHTVVAECCVLGMLVTTACSDSTSTDPSAPGAAPVASSMRVIGGGWEVLNTLSTVVHDPAVIVYDQFHLPFARSEVRCTIGSGGGTVTTPTVLTDSIGEARCAGWQTGAAEGWNDLVVSAGKVSATFSVRAIMPLAGAARYDLVDRTIGMDPSSEGGYIELTPAGDYKRVSYWGRGTRFLACRIGAGRFQTVGDSLVFSQEFAKAKLSGARLEYVYRDLNFGDPVVEVYIRH